LLRFIPDEFVVFFIRWTEKDVQRGVAGSIEEMIFGSDIFPQHPVEILDMVAARKFPWPACRPVSSWHGDGRRI
jgi:hypothetical protein